MEMQSGGQRYRSMAEENVAASSDVTVLPETLEVTVNVPNLIASEYCTRYGRMLGARRFAGMFLDGQSRTMVDCRGVRYDTDIGAWERRRSVMLLWCAGTINSAGPFDMPFVYHVDEVAYVQLLYELFRKLCEKSTQEEGFN